jgi:recombination protein RecR
MADSIIPKLVEFFQRLPGIGPRQARRFVYSLADENPKVLEEFSNLIMQLGKEVSRCKECFRIFAGEAELCNICKSTARDSSKLLVVERDADLENLEKNQIFDGKYHVLGGVISPLRPEREEKLRLKELFQKVQRNDDIKEIILALSTTTEGDMTARYIEEMLRPLVSKKSLKVSHLGRGLSTGTELEYSDRDTLRHAFENRK